jgi:F-type H+-transporting ATPase subunit delta
MTDVERQYARAVFSLALERNEVDIVYQELRTFIDSLGHNAKQFFSHPKIDRLDKQAVLEKVIKNKLLTNFLKVLIDNDRFELLETVAYAYLDLINEMNEVVEVVVYSNTKITASNIEKIKISLEKKLLKKINMTQIIDPSIIGGIKIEYQGSVIDQTINTSLEALKQTLTGGN